MSTAIEPPRFTFTPRGVIALWCRKWNLAADAEQVDGLVALLWGVSSQAGVIAVVNLWCAHNFRDRTPDTSELASCFRCA